MRHHPLRHCPLCPKPAAYPNLWSRGGRKYSVSLMPWDIVFHYRVQNVQNIFPLTAIVGGWRDFNAETRKSHSKYRTINPNVIFYMTNNTVPFGFSSKHVTRCLFTNYNVPLLLYKWRKELIGNRNIYDFRCVPPKKKKRFTDVSRNLRNRHWWTV